MAAQRAVLVLGMHRSGTSALSRVINLLGATAPAVLVDPGPDNPRGFWEPERVVRLNDALLAETASSWDDWRAFAPERLAPATIEAFEQRAEAVLAADFGSAPLFVLKDPRIARMLGVWLPVLQRFGAAPCAVLALRHPAAVARSLAVRNGMAVEHAVLLWLRHMLDAERDSRDMPRAVVLYDDLLSDWQAVASRLVAALGIEWPAAPVAAIDAFLDQDLRHGLPADLPFRSAYAEVWVRHGWAALSGLGRQEPSAPLFEALDRVRAQFDDSCRLFGPSVTLPRPSLARLPDLSRVTLCAADSAMVPLTVRALHASAERCRVADAVLFSDRAQGSLRTVPIAPLASRDAYSAFVLRSLAEHISTSHALLVQWDGYVVDAASWLPEFLDYDYVGAAWGRYEDGMDIGNGGFSLRSRRLLDALQDDRFAFAPGVAEDELIGRIWRPALEREFGIRFAPPDLASRFAYERVLPSAPTFGFHGMFNFWRHLTDADTEAVSRALPDNMLDRREFAQWVALCFLHGRITALRLLAERWRRVRTAEQIGAAMQGILEARTASCLEAMALA